MLTLFVPPPARSTMTIRQQQRQGERPPESYRILTRRDWCTRISESGGGSRIAPRTNRHVVASSTNSSLAWQHLKFGMAEQISGLPLA
jgi:hypothetical protein